MFYFMGNDGRYTSPKNLLWTWSNMGVEPREVMESPLLHIFKTWQVPKQHILVIPLSWPPKIYIDLYKVYLTIYMVLCCGALVFWIRKKILGKVYCCVRYQPQYQCVRISVILPVQDMLCSLWACLPAPKSNWLCLFCPGLWWGCPMLVDNRESVLRKALDCLCHSHTHSVMAGWMKPRDWSSVDEWSLGTRSWVGSVSESSWNEKTNENLGREWNGTRSSQAGMWGQVKLSLWEK